MFSNQEYSGDNARLYSEIREQDRWRREIEIPSVIALLRKISVKNKEILELGCGSGTYTRIALELLGAARVEGYDKSEDMIKEANCSCINPDKEKYVVQDVKKLETKDHEKFPIVLVIYMFNYAETIEELSQLMFIVYELLTDEGTAVGVADNRTPIKDYALLAKYRLHRNPSVKDSNEIQPGEKNIYSFGESFEQGFKITNYAFSRKDWQKCADARNLILEWYPLDIPASNPEEKAHWGVFSETPPIEIFTLRKKM